VTVAASARSGEAFCSGDVERIAPPSAEEFRRRYVDARKPVIIVGALDDWPARRTWSAEYLATAFGDRRIPVAGVARRRVENYGDSGIPYREEPLRACIEHLQAATPDYGYAMFLLDESLPELKADLRTPAFAPPAPWSIYKFWMSAADTRTPLHMDLPDNLFMQFVGRKEVRLFAPAQEWKMYRHPPWSRLPQVSRVDAYDPDLARHPRFAQARALHCLVEPGEMLYIPRFWWHQIRSLSFSISVNYWWATGWVWQIVRSALAYQRLRQLRF
jgi:[protein]-arginine 3-hydroxylase / protease